MEIEWADPCATSARWFTVHKASMYDDHTSTSFISHAVASVESLACSVQITRDPGVLQSFWNQIPLPLFRRPIAGP